MKVEFVEFGVCHCGVDAIDIRCVACESRICSFHLKLCIQCEQHVCKQCYKEDLCCLQRPWGEKTAKQLKALYQDNMILDQKALGVMEQQKRGFWKGFPKEVVEKTMLYYVKNLDHSAFRFVSTITAKHFPRVSEFLETEKMRLEFSSFLKKIPYPMVIEIIVYSEDREDMLSLMDDVIRTYEEIERYLIKRSLQTDGKRLFECLKKRGLLDFNLIDLKSCSIGHIDGLEWIQENGIDVVKDKEHFELFVMESPAKVMEYLILEKGMTVEYMTGLRAINFDILKMIYKCKGLKEIQNIDIKKMVFDFETLKFLRSIEYKSEEKQVIEQCRLFDEMMYALACFGMLKFKDSNNYQRRKIKSYTSKNDPKACKNLFPFMKEIRKKKIMTVVLCLRKTRGLQKEIVWKIIDLAYSPINERGSF